MRQVVTAKDIQCYFGKKESMSFKMMRQMKKDLGKQNHQPITITEFCQYYNVEKEGIIEIINRVEKDKEKKGKEIPDTDSVMNKNTINKQPIAITNQNQSYCFSKKSW